MIAHRAAPLALLLLALCPGGLSLLALAAPARRCKGVSSSQVDLRGGSRRLSNQPGLPPHMASHAGMAHAGRDGGLLQQPPLYRSPLWGRKGELWTPAGPIADFSLSGYSGEGKPIPSYSAPHAYDIRRFGAQTTPGFGAPGPMTAQAAAASPCSHAT